MDHLYYTTIYPRWNQELTRELLLSQLQCLQSQSNTLCKAHRNHHKIITPQYSHRLYGRKIIVNKVIYEVKYDGLFSHVFNTMIFKPTYKIF